MSASDDIAATLAFDRQRRSISAMHTVDDN
jgi:hypothetical protein